MTRISIVGIVGMGSMGLGLWALAGGCGSDGGGPVTVASMGATNARLERSLCQCWYGAEGAAAVDRCVAMNVDPASAEEVSCLTEVYANAANGQAYLECIAARSRRWLDCRLLACNAPPPEQFKCDNGTKVDQDRVCDDRNDCGDGSDERGCDASFVCRDGMEISAEWVCDGEDDCADRSDEAACGGSTDPLAQCYADLFESPDCPELTAAEMEAVDGCYGSGVQ